jgi:ABC-type protease/lipase transport system fused ATPase/permease subunit
MILMQGITKVYRLSEVSVTVLKGIDISIQQGEYVAIMGASGSGKSTLMNIIGCLDRSTAGDYNLEGRDLMRLDDEQLAYVRNQRIGFVFQQFNLLPRSTAQTPPTGDRSLDPSRIGRLSVQPSDPTFGRTTTARGRSARASQPASLGTSRRTHRRAR